MGLAEVNTKMDAAVAALAGGDYDAAMELAVQAQGLLSVIPESDLPGGSSVRFARGDDRINNFIINLRRRQAGALGMQRSKITYGRATS